jgi:hypothetical protein
MRHAYDPDPPARGREAPEPQPPSGRSARVRPLRPSDARLDAAVCDAVFRYQLQQPLAEAPHPPRYYLAWPGHEADDARLGRLRALGSTVQPLSQCRVTAREGVVDRATGARGIIVQVARLTWLHAAAVDVVGGYYLTHRQAAGFRYRVESAGQRWAVTTTSGGPSLRRPMPLIRPAEWHLSVHIRALAGPDVWHICVGMVCSSCPVGVY